MKRTALFLLILVVALGCASSGVVSMDIRPRAVPNRGIEYEGPMVGPYDSFTKMAQVACQRMSALQAQPGQPQRPGYCALMFPWPRDSRKWAFLHISEMTSTPAGDGRQCALPEDPVHPEVTSVLSLGGAPTSPAATGASSTWRPTRFLNEKTGTSWDYDSMLFSLESPGGCTAYAYIGFSRELSVLQDDTWVPVGTVYNNEGIVQALKSGE